MRQPDNISESRKSYGMIEHNKVFQLH